MDAIGPLARKVKKAGYRRIMVTGASGFIGRELSISLAGAGIEVYGLYRNPAAVGFLKKGGVLPVRGDITRPEEWNRYLEQSDALFHMAALAAPWHPDPGAFYTLNCVAAEKVFEQALLKGVRRIVFTSTAGTMGFRQRADEPPIHEGTFRSPPLETPYEESKLKAEHIARELQGDSDADIVIVNPSRVFGPGMISDSNAVTKLISWYLKGYWRILPGDGSSIGNYVYIEDVIQGHLKALLHGRSGERYILGGENADFETLFDLIGKTSGKKRQMFSLPAPIMLAVAREEEWRARFLGGSPLITVPFAKKYIRHFPLTVEKAENELDYRPRSLEESIRHTVEWVKEQP